MYDVLSQEIINDVFINNPTKIFRDIEKAHCISKLRLLGYTYKEIGKECDVSPSRARDYVVRTMAIYRHRKAKEQLREKAHHKMTNYEKIKNMSIEEMAEFLAYERRGVCAEVGTYECDKYDDCTICFRKWLESEVEE